MYIQNESVAAKSSLVIVLCLSVASLLILHLCHLFSDVVSIVEADHEDDCNLHQEVHDREENDSVMETLLPFLHFI